MQVYRLCKTIYANDLTGVGASLFGGRWNPRGIPMLYTAGSISLACLEYLVHNMHLVNNQDICLAKIEIPDTDSIEEVNLSKLPKDWREKSYEPFSTQQIGLGFFQKGESHVLKVPSAIVPNEWNYLFNPQHPNHKNIKLVDKLVPFHMDERLFGK